MQSGLRIRNQKDFAAGVIYVLAGASFGIGAINYKIGDAARMGPGYFPLMIGILLTIVGLFTLFGAVTPKAQDDKVKLPHLPTIAWILGSVVLFGLLLQPAGLIASLAVLIIVSSLASHEFAWKGALINTVVLILFSVGVFVKGIDLLIPLWPAFVR